MTLVNVSKKKVAGCLACEYCHNKGNGACIQKDDMQELYPLMNEAEVLALAVAGFTGIDALVQMLKTIIISIWCLAEALCDVKALLNGGKIPAVKEPYEWTVSSVGLKNFSKTVLPSATSENGLDYKEYLRLLLLMTGTKDQVFRTMDLIQANACSKYNNDFRMAECICSIDIETEYHADQLFTAFLFVRNILENKQGGYSFSFRQKYEY